MSLKRSPGRAREIGRSRSIILQVWGRIDQYITYAISGLANSPDERGSVSEAVIMVRAKARTYGIYYS